jgi:hypothetical protein
MSPTTARRPLPALVFLLILTVLTGIVWWRVLHRNDDSPTGSTPVVVQPIRCTPGAGAIALPKPSAVTVDVLNGASRDQLATQVSTQLKSRGFLVGKPDTAPSTVSGTGQIQFGTAGRAAATLLSYYLPGATMVAQNRSDAIITLVLGTGFKTLASQAVVTKSVAKAKKPC